MAIPRQLGAVGLLLTTNYSGCAAHNVERELYRLLCIDVGHCDKLNETTGCFSLVGCFLLMATGAGYRKNQINASEPKLRHS
jgi:hypothetical protein